jgi:hypothetical protein
MLNIFSLIEILFYYYYQGDIAIDDIDRLTISCQEPNNCDYEEDTFCGWDNDKKTDQFDWEITRGPSTETYATGINQTKIDFEISFFLFVCLFVGPFVDHTLGTPEGSYAYIDSNNNRKINDTAILISQSIADTGSNGMCIEFFYHM